jgi:nitroreductase
MDIEEAIRSRRSIRAFTNEEVEQEKISRILALAQRSPSGTNTQPWHTYVCKGDVKDAIVRDVCTLFDQGQAKSYAEYDYYPNKWNDIHTARRRKIGWDLYGLVGIKKGDRERTAIQARRNYCFFDAPIGMFFTTDAYLGRGSWSDVGLYMQTVMLAARGEGLHTCPQAAWISFQDPIFKHLNIPNDQVIVSGMGLGYEDSSAIENTLVSEREQVSNVVNYVGFN